MTEPHSNRSIASDQRPTNNHNRIITGIGTPNNQSKSPRPTIASMHLSWIKNVGGDAGFRYAEAMGPCARRETEEKLLIDVRLSVEASTKWPLAGFHELGISAVFASHLQQLSADFCIRDLTGQALGLVGLKFIVLGLAHGDLESR